MAGEATLTPRREGVPLLKFTPSAQDTSVLEEITVQRESLIQRLVRSALDQAGGPRHHLLVGPRGIGKTHILSLVASRIQHSERSDSIVVAWLDEDPWAVRNYDKLLAAVVAAVARDLDDPELARRASDVRATGDGSYAEGLLRRVVGSRRLVLLAENLDQVFRRIGPDGQSKLRAFAENWQRLLIIATTPLLFEGVRRHASPFYGFFAITHLDEMDLEHATELLKRVARLRGDEELLNFLDTETARRRLMAVEALAGGNPRVWLLLAGCLSISAIDKLVPLFLEALDDLTPYYQDRLRELGEQQQEVIVLLSEAAGALSNRELAERSGIPQNQIANLVRQLVDRGYIRRAQLPERLNSGDQRTSFWELREPLLRLTFDVKQARGEPLRIVVEFLRAWYGVRLLDELLRLPADAELATSYAQEAFRKLELPDRFPDLIQGSPFELVSRAELGLSLVPRSTELRIAKALGLAGEERYAEARALLEELAAKESDPLLSLLARVQLAYVQRALGEEVDVSQLISDTKNVVNAVPDTAVATAFLASTQSLLELHDEAIVTWDRAIELDADNPNFHFQRSLALTNAGRPREALAAATRAAELDPDTARYHDLRGALLIQLGRYEEAAEASIRAVGLDPQKAEFHARLGTAATGLAHYEEALAHFTRASDLEPETAEYDAARGFLLAELGRHAEALTIYEHAIGDREPDEQLHVLFAMTLEAMGRSEDALTSYSRALALNPEDDQAHALRGTLLSRLGRHDEAIADLTRATEIEPMRADHHWARGVALSRLGREEEALIVHTQAIELNPADPRPHVSRGHVLTRLGRFEEALAAYTRAGELGPDRADIHTGRGATLLALGRDGDALAALTRAVQIDPENASLQAARGFVLTRLDRDDEALEAYTRAAELDPSDAGHQNWRANLLRAAGQIAEAEHAARRAVELDDKPLHRFTLAEVMIAAGDVQRGVEELRDALAAWAADRSVAPGETGLLCRLVWDHYGNRDRRRELIAELIAVYDQADAIEELGRGVVSSISLFAADDVSQEEADAWVEDWGYGVAPPALEIPLSLLEAARLWKRDRDRAHLLALPPEQRQILVDLVAPGDAATD